MERFMRIAFWIFTLSVMLYDCRPTLNLSDYNIKFMKKFVKCNDSEFYTPNPTEETCFTSALECIYKELNGPAREECNDPDKRIDQGLESLNNLIHERKEDNPTTPHPTACTCENWNTSPLDNFLDNYESLLQKINAAAAGR